MASTYPGIIPYRSSSPSSPENNGVTEPQLIRVNNNFSLRRSVRSASIAENEEILRERYYQYWSQQQVRK